MTINATEAGSTSALKKGESFDAIRSKVQAALDLKMKGSGVDRTYCWIRDLFADKVVYSMNDGELFQADYSIDSKDVVTLGDSTAVDISYVPSNESARMVLGEVTQFKEAATVDAKGNLTVTVIKPGFNISKQRFYPASTLKRDHKIFEGAKMFADHQTDKQAKEQPEGSVNNWVGTVSKTWAESDGTVKAQVKVIDPPFKAKLDELNKQGMLKEMGISIRAIGEAAKMKVEGTDTNYVESLIRARSVDFVTYAGAGGQVEAMESAQADENDVDLVSETQLRERRPDLVELIESNARKESVVNKTLEQQLSEANTQLAAEKQRADDLQKKFDVSEAATKKATAKVELTKLLGESKLPEMAQKRLEKQFAEAVSTEGMKEAIDLEKEYVKSLGVTVTPKNMGTKENGVAETNRGDKKPNLVESFKKLGMSDEEAKIAANIQ